MQEAHGKGRHDVLEVTMTALVGLRPGTSRLPGVTVVRAGQPSSNGVDSGWAGGVGYLHAMCYFITATLPADSDLEQLRPIVDRHHLGFFSAG
jgi:hypothetical protein